MEKIIRVRHEYDIQAMTVKAWDNVFAYWRYDVSGIPDEIRLYCLKGFIDDLQDCTTNIKKSDYPKSDKGLANYAADCLEKRRMLEKAINDGTRLRAETSNTKQELLTAKSLVQLLARKVAGQKLTTEEEKWIVDMTAKYMSSPSQAEIKNKK